MFSEMQSKLDIDLYKLSYSFEIKEKSLINNYKWDCRI